MHISYAQPILYGTNQVGNGNIVKYDINNNRLEPVYTFSNDGLFPKGLAELTRGIDGLYYGVTTKGGATGGGVIFQVDSINRTYKLVHNFSTETGEFPTGKLLASQNGKLYGMASGKSETDPPFKDNSGIIFSFDPVTQVYAVVWNLGSYGHIPIGGLAEGDYGKLYGIVTDIYFNHYGKIFSFDVQTNSYSIEYLFNEATGVFPGAGMMKANDGKLYGLTANGGLNSSGVLYSFDPKSGIYIVEKYFNQTVDGSFPRGSLSREYNGTFYGTTNEGGIHGYGIIFSFSVASKLFSVLHSLPEDENYPSHNFSYDLGVGADGTLYGMDQFGFYSFNITTQKYLHLQEQQNPSVPGLHETLIINDTGVVTVHPGMEGYALLKRLDAPNGLAPLDNLMQGSDHLLYGTTSKGGKNNRGGIFSFDPVKVTFQQLANFDTTVPGIISPLLEMPDHGIYFISSHGGVRNQGEGELIHFDPLEKSFEVIHQFDAWGDGSANEGVLVKGPDGYLYGSTFLGGFYGGGVLYRFSIFDNQYEKLYDFNDVPQSKSLIVGTDGKAYGYFGQSSDFRINNFYSLDPVTKVFTRYPYSTQEFGRTLNMLPAMDSLGKIYAFSGIILRFDPSNQAFDKVLDINQTTGSPILDPMLISKEGILYVSTVFRNLEEEPNEPFIHQLISVNTISKEYKPLTFMQGSSLFRPTVLYKQQVQEDIPIVTILDTSVYESDGKAVVRIHLSKPLPYKLKLNYRTINVTASSSKPDRDYIGANGHINIRKGAVDKTIRITVLKDKLNEPAEQFIMKISKAGSVSDTIAITDDEATITILDGKRPASIIPVSIETVSKSLVSIQPKSSTLEFNVVVTPNPSNTVFNIRMNGNAEQIKIKIVDALGRIMYNQTSVKSNSNWLIGSDWHPGIYFAIIQQGKETRVIKLVKNVR